jgi:predicted nucleic acid-binding protein
MPGSFLDSNVLIYFAAATPVKAAQAEALIAAGSTISVQVLNEVATVGRRKMKLSWDELDDVLRRIRAALDVVPVTLEVHDRGLAIARRYGLSIYDGSIASAALLSGCNTLWSEDMHDGLVIERRLTVRNPFSGVA